MTTTARGSRFSPPAVWLGAFALAFWVSHTMLRPLLGPYAQELGLSAGQIGVVIGIQAIPAVLFAIPLGSALDRSGARRILAAGAGLMLAGGLVMLVAKDAVTLIVAQVVLGFGTLGVWLTIQSLVTFASSDPARRSRSIANYSVCIVSGQLLGPLVGGAVADAFGYLASFAVFATVCVALVAAAFTRYPDRDFGASPARADRHPDAGAEPIATAPDSPPSEGRRSSHRDALVLLRHRGVLLTVVVSFLALFLVDLRMTFLPVLLGGIGWSPTAIGVLLSTSSACALLARPLFPAIVARFGTAAVVALCLVPGAFALGSFAATSETAVLFILAAFAGVSLGLAQPLTLSLTAEFTGPSQRGLAVALRVMANRLALWLSPMAFGVLVTVIGIRPAFVVGTCALGVAAVVMAWRFRRVADHDVRRPSAPRDRG